MPPIESLKKILPNNLLVFVVLLFGIFTFGLTSIFQLFHIGINLGFTTSVPLKWGLRGETLFWFIFPHLIPEIVGFCLVGSLGFRSLMMFIRYLKGGELIEQKEIKRIAIIAMVSLILVIIAAFIESYVTPEIGRQYL